MRSKHLRLTGLIVFATMFIIAVVTKAQTGIQFCCGLAALLSIATDILNPDIGSKD